MKPTQDTYYPQDVDRYVKVKSVHIWTRLECNDDGPVYKAKTKEVITADSSHLKDLIMPVGNRG